MIWEEFDYNNIAISNNKTKLYLENLDMEILNKDLNFLLVDENEKDENDEKIEK